MSPSVLCAPSYFEMGAVSVPFLSALVCVILSAIFLAGLWQILLCVLSASVVSYSISMAVAMPMPPPPQIVASPMLLPFFFIA